MGDVDDLAARLLELEDPSDLSQALQHATRDSKTVANRLDYAYNTARSVESVGNGAIVNDAYDDFMFDLDDKIRLTGRVEKLAPDLADDLARVEPWSNRLVTVLDCAAVFAASDETAPSVRRGTRKALVRARALHDFVRAFDPANVHYRRWRGALRGARRQALKIERICARCAKKHDGR